MLIKAAINGIRTGDFHPTLPFDHRKAAQASQQAIAAGAEAIHVHVWNDQGHESLHPDDVARWLSAIRAACPQVPVGISTGAWIVPDLAERLRLIAAWYVYPDFVSLNTEEAGFEGVADILLEKGIGIEAGLSTIASAKAFAWWKENGRSLRILLEPNEPTTPLAKETVLGMEAILEITAPKLPRLLHGLDTTTWDMLHLAAQRGYATRIGFEDTVWLPDGKMVESNAELVAAAREIFKSYGRY
ncbi:MAG: 3-keto-5-aminohexanoate cleavage protein [Chloroflexota bacterium]